MVSCHLALNRVKAIAVDFSAAHVDSCAKDAGVEFVSGNVQTLPFDGASFDLVFSYNAFDYFSDPRAALCEALRVVEPGGSLYFRFGPLHRA